METDMFAAITANDKERVAAVDCGRPEGGARPQFWRYFCTDAGALRKQAGDR